MVPPERETTIGADLGYLKYAIFHGDSRIFSVTLAADPADRAMRALLREPGFEATARQLPPMARWVDPAVAEPITTVFGMDGLRNMRRRFVRDGRPLLRGLLAIGDAAHPLEPALRPRLHARLRARRAAGRRGRRPRRTTSRPSRCDFDAATERELVPWYKLAVAQDRDAIAWARSLREQGAAAGARPGPGAVDPRAYLRDLLLRGLVPALRLDATVLRAFMRSFNLLDPPGDLMREPALLGRVLAVYQKRPRAGRAGPRPRPRGPAARHRGGMSPRRVRIPPGPACRSRSHFGRLATRDATRSASTATYSVVSDARDRVALRSEVF